MSTNLTAHAGGTAPGMLVATRTLSRADAERAVELLVSAGVSRVMLFGSVAPGEASERRTGEVDWDNDVALHVSGYGGGSPSCTPSRHGPGSSGRSVIRANPERVRFRNG